MFFRIGPEDRVGGQPLLIDDAGPADQGAVGVERDPDPALDLVRVLDPDRGVPARPHPLADLADQGGDQALLRRAGDGEESACRRGVVARGAWTAFLPTATHRNT